jgi:hypothetical protein
MSDTIKARKFRKRIHIDRIGSKSSILRKTNESEEAYNDRIVTAYKNMFEHDQQAFWRSLEYITSYGCKRICEVTFQGSELENYSMEIDQEKIRIYDGQNTHIFEYKEYKFLIDIYDAIKEIEGIQVTDLFDSNDSSWHFLLSESVVPQTTDKIYFDFRIDKSSKPFPRKNVFDAYSTEIAQDLVVEEDAVEIENDLVGVNSYFNYRDFPVPIIWTPFKVLECNHELFKKITHDEDGSLTQDGAKVINMILAKQNTYWGN